MSLIHSRWALTAAAFGATLGCARVNGPSTSRCAFVSNLHQDEGSVTSFTFAANGQAQFVAKFVTGSGSTSPGRSAYALALSPSGKVLAVTHATPATAERVTLLNVHADATMSSFHTFVTGDNATRVVWIKEDVLAIRTSGALRLYRITGLSIDQFQFQSTPGASSGLALSADKAWLGISHGPLSEVMVYRVLPDGSVYPTPVMYTGLCSPGSLLFATGPKCLYSTCGFSTGNVGLLGFGLDVNSGLWLPLPGFPFQSPSSSPGSMAESPDGEYLVSLHSSSHLRISAINQASGGLTDLGQFYSFGNDEGREIACVGDLVLATRSSNGSLQNTGLYSFTWSNGSLVSNGPLVQTQALGAFRIETWDPPRCYPNCDASTATPALTANDFQCFINRYASGHAYANCDHSTGVPALTANDFQCFINSYVGGCS